MKARRKHDGAVIEVYSFVKGIYTDERSGVDYCEDELIFECRPCQMTERTIVATEVLGALVSSSTLSPTDASALAVRYADALIEELGGDE